MSVQDQTAAFEHMYTPGRAKSLFGRHRDLTSGCDRKKAILDFEWQIFSNQVDKEKNRFKITSAWLLRRLDQLASQRPIIDPSEFEEPKPVELSPVRAAVRGLPHSSPLRRTKATAAPGQHRHAAGIGTTSVSVRSLEVRKPETSSSGSGSSIDEESAARRIKFYQDGSSGGGNTCRLPITRRRRSKAGEKKVFKEMRVQQLKQNCCLERAVLDRKVNEFVQEIETYKERHRCDIEGRPKVDADETSGPSRFAANVCQSRQHNEEAKYDSHPDLLRSLDRSRTSAVHSILKASTAEPPSPLLPANGPRADSIRTRRENERKDYCASRRDAADSTKRISLSAAAADNKRQADVNNDGGDDDGNNSVPNPKPNTLDGKRNRFSLVGNDASRPARNRGKPAPPRSLTEDDITKTMMLGAWEAFSRNVSPESFQDLVSFAAKHKVKRRTPSKRYDGHTRWASITSRMILAERAVSAFGMGVEKQRQRRLGITSPRGFEGELS